MSMSIQLNITRGGGGGGGAKQNIEKMGRLNSARQCTILDLESLKGGGGGGGGGGKKIYYM